MEYGKEILIIAERSMASNATNIFVGQLDNNTHKLSRGKVVFEPEEEGVRFEPTLSFKYRDDPRLQQFMDSLWNCGVRPTEIGTAGQLAATQNHLNDMRTIAFKFLKIGEPKK